MPLTNTAIRNAKPSNKPIRLFDERGLYLEVSPTGGKWWRLKFRFEGKEKRLSLGVYPDVPLKDARDRRDIARKLLADGIDPSENRKAQKLARADSAANSFEVVAREWLNKMAPTWVDSYSSRVIARLEQDIFPRLGARPIGEITPPELLAVLRLVESREALETAHRLLTKCGQIFRYGIATSRCSADVSRDLRDALSRPVKGHLAAATKPEQIAPILRAIDGYRGTVVVRSALLLAPLVFVRPGELRKAKWADISLDSAEWTFIPSKRRANEDKPNELVVPLARQAVEILRELHYVTGTEQFVFPSARSNKRPMSDNAVLAAMRRMGIGKEEMCGHGFRAMARTILDEVLHVRPDIIEHQLGHVVRDPNGRAYNRTAFLPERRQMMQKWADYLDQLRAGTSTHVNEGEPAASIKKRKTA
jgi:integrase